MNGPIAGLAAALSLAACGLGGPSGSPPTCELGHAPPAGYEAVSSKSINEGDHIGVATVYERGTHKLLLSAGWSADFGEDQPVAAQLLVSAGANATLFGRGEHWILVWYQQGACHTHTAQADGVTRSEFAALLREMGIIRLPESEAAPSG